MEPWTGVIDVPANRRGRFYVEHVVAAAGTSFPTTNWRTLIVGGQEGVGNATFDQQTKWHRLREVDERNTTNPDDPLDPEHQDGTWMSDFPIEQAQADALCEGMHGRVLVGGLGLGYVATILCQRPEIEHVTVVERERAVVELVGQHTQGHGKLEICTDDLFNYLRRKRNNIQAGTLKPWDFALYDIWAPDGMAEFFNLVVPLRGLSVGMVNEPGIKCWNEDVMRGQLASCLQSFALRPKMQELGLWGDDPLPGGDAEGFFQRIVDGGLDTAPIVYLDWMGTFFEAVLAGAFDAENAIYQALYVELYGRGADWRNDWWNEVVRLNAAEDEGKL